MILAAEPGLEALVAQFPLMRSILSAINEPLEVAAEQTAPLATFNTDVLKDTLPSGARNGSANLVNLLFLPGDLGEANKKSAALLGLIEALKLETEGKFGVAVANSTGSGKTKTAIDFFRVR